MLTPAQLADLLLSPLTKRYMVFMLERMSRAMAYHRQDNKKTSDTLLYFFWNFFQSLSDFRLLYQEVSNYNLFLYFLPRLLSDMIVIYLT